MNHVSPGKIAIIAGGGVTFLFSFLSWWTVSYNNHGNSAWSDGLFGPATWAPLFGLVAVLLVALPAFANVKLPDDVLGFTIDQLVLVAGVFATLITLGFMIGTPNGFDVGIGLIFCFLGSAAIVVGWFLDRQDTVSGKVRGVITFSAGGALHYQDIFPASLVVLTGSWVGSGREFRFEMWAGSAADAATNRPAITIRIKGPLSLTQRGLTSPYAVSWFDPATGAELFRFDGTANGTRIEP